MAEYIDREKAIALIEEKQKELCPVGRYGRNYVYGSDREKYDSWEEIIDQLENIETADVAPVVHGQWKFDTRGLYPKPLCSRCSEEPWRKSNHQSDLPKYCPNCGAKMDGEPHDNT